MLRRTWLQGALATGGAALAGAARAQPAAAGPDPAAVRALVRDGYIFTLPLLEVCRTRDKAMAAGLPANRFTHKRKLAGPADREVTTPNTDTLYSTAFLDLRQGPVTLTSPAAGERYFSLALMDAWSNNFHIAGTRTDGGRAARILLATEDQARTVQPDVGTRLVIAPTKWVWALGRTLVDGPADLEAAHRVQDGVTVTGAAGPPPPKAPPRDAPIPVLLAQGQEVASDAGPLKTDMPALMGFLRRGLMLGLDLGAINDPALIALAEQGIGEAKARLRTAAAQTPVGGWTYPKPTLGNFGTDYEYRAAIAVAGLAALPVEEAVYLWAEGDGAAGAPPRTYDGRRAWRLDLPRLPLDAFWSLSLYEATPQGGYFFTDNPLGRYAIGDRTPGLMKTGDGGSTIWIGAVDPGAARRANWLPAPAGPFALVLRAYLPRPELRDGRFRLPPVRAA